MSVIRKALVATAALFVCYAMLYGYLRWCFQTGESFTYVAQDSVNSRLIVKVAPLFVPLAFVESALTGDPAELYRIQFKRRKHGR